MIPFAVGALLVLFSITGIGDDADADAGDAYGIDNTGDSGDLGSNDSNVDDSQAHEASTPHHSSISVRNIPPLMLLQNFLLFWGILSWSVNGFLQAGRTPQQFVVLSMLAALCGGVFLTLLLSSILSRLTPGNEGFVATKHGLQGRAGEAVSGVTDSIGSVYVCNAGGTLHHLPARVRRGAKPVAKGERVLVIEYQKEGDYYWIKQWNDAVDVTSV